MRDLESFQKKLTEIETMLAPLDGVPAVHGIMGEALAEAERRKHKIALDKAVNLLLEQDESERKVNQAFREAEGIARKQTKETEKRRKAIQRILNNEPESEETDDD